MGITIGKERYHQHQPLAVRDSLYTGTLLLSYRSLFFREVSESLRSEPRFQAVESDRDRETLFLDYLAFVRRKEAEDAAAQRESGLRHVRELLQQAQVTEATLWKDALAQLTSLPEFQSSHVLRDLELKDILKIYEELIRELERDSAAQRTRRREEERRGERQHREELRVCDRAPIIQLGNPNRRCLGSAQRLCSARDCQRTHAMAGRSATPAGDVALSRHARAAGVHCARSLPRRVSRLA